ncbi:DUF3696 domain-containing protein [Bacteroides sp. 519]|uniref:AAA family ATPase n=1 Tax=Bacteroides sp. 519 TaxID=2302937 RepID=UPI0013D8502A|nr:DUF3696 domain-containing protein [Bacteroides sp. 519]NDV60254.1 DUF3696 domain-containing protein [Bacteroides sp. 519]
MIQNIEIEGLKSIEQQELTIKPLTILTGLNSTGKSTVLQAILLVSKHITKNRTVFDAHNILSSFQTLRNIYKRSKEIKIELKISGEVIRLVLNDDDSVLIQANENQTLSELEKNLYYLSAGRIGPEEVARMDNQHIYCGENGSYLFGTFEKEKSTPVAEKLIKETSSYTLSTQLNYWLSYILDIKLELNTEKRTEQSTEVRFKSDGIPNLLPTQLGAGVSYLAKILILCLRAKPDDTIMIENPEIHLHPAAQSRLGEFFSFIAQAGIQLIIETHCEHLINKVQYEIFKKKIKAEDVAIYYKKGITIPYVEIVLNENGRFNDEFPEGFFDATLAELLEME